MDYEVKQTGAVITPSLFQPDELAPHDFEENSRRKDRLGPEERLLLAVLEDAISCYQDYLLAQKAEERVLFAEAERWIFDDGVQFVSFCNICELLKINPGYVRRGLLMWKQGRLARTVTSSSRPRWRTVARGHRRVRIAAPAKSRPHCHNARNFS
jgi:hypothetical protein